MSRERDVKREKERGKETGIICQQKEMAYDRDVNRMGGQEKDIYQEKELSRDRNAKKEGCQCKTLQEKQMPRPKNAKPLNLCVNGGHSGLRMACAMAHRLAAFFADAGCVLGCTHHLEHCIKC